MYWVKARIYFSPTHWMNLNTEIGYEILHCHISCPHSSHHYDEDMIMKFYLNTRQQLISLSNHLHVVCLVLKLILSQAINQDFGTD